MSGLSGSGLVLAINGGGNLNIAGNGAFAFSGALATGAAYTVTVVTQPSNPSQVCSIVGGTGTVASANVTSVSVSCGVAGRFAYVTNNGLNSIDSVSAYSINATTGLLTPLPGSPYASSRLPVDLAIRPDGKFLYVATASGSPSTGFITVYAIDNTTGALSQIAGSPFATPTTLYSIAIDPSGKFAYTANFTSATASAFSLDATTGAPTLVTGSPVAAVGTPVSVAVDPSGKFVYVGTVGGGPGNNGTVCAYAIDSSTGALTQILGSPFPSGASGAVNSVTVDPSGKFLFAPHSAGVLSFTIDATSGALTPVAGSPFPASSAPQAAAVDPTGKFVYVAHNSSGSNALILGYSVDAATGALAQIAGNPFPSVDRPFFITVDPSGNFAYVANIASDVITVYSVNKTTGILTATGSPIPNGAGTNPSAIAILP